MTFHQGYVEAMEKIIEQKNEAFQWIDFAKAALVLLRDYRAALLMGDSEQQGRTWTMVIELLEAPQTRAFLQAYDKQALEDLEARAALPSVPPADAGHDAV